MRGLIPERKTEEEAYEAGRDSALNGPNESNCHFAFFAAPELTAAWERGRDEAGAKAE